MEFKQALSLLGIKSDPASPPDIAERRTIRAWANEQREKLNERIRELDEKIFYADEIPDPELAESFWRERRIVADLRDDLARAEYLPDFIELKDPLKR